MPTDEEIEEAARRFEIWADNLDPATCRVIDGAPIRAIAEAADQPVRDEALLAERVATARAHGHRWSIIAVALDVSQQEARRRYGGETDT
jgi:hypothetical protein